MKQFLVGVSALVFAVFYVACSNSVTPSSDKLSEFSLDSSLAGMIRVKASGEEVSLGTNEMTAKTSERPEMRVRFDYDFSIGKHEVLCSDFNELMRPEFGLSLLCENDSLPAADLTYYDAVLFANARSKAEHYDTAYTYVAATFDAEKHCTNLEGFAYRPDAEGYRLPTEAEWVYVASRDWNVQKGWTAENSGYVAHKACSIKMAENAPCDMVGNVMEWVGDWQGLFRDTTILNYVGAPDGDALGQRVVKGGSFRNAEKSTTPYTRGDVYTVTSATKANYVGFRLAFGSIKGASWLNSSGDVVESRVVSLVSPSTVRSMTGTYRTKLAFRNDITGNLAFVDFSGGTNSVVEIKDSLDVYHPDISPDGKKVAFSTGFEGISSKSALYVRDLNASGSNLVKLNVESAAIPRWRVLGNGDTAIVYVTDAGNNKDDAAFKSASTWQVAFANGKFGTPKKLFDGAYHGGISADDRLAVTGARLLRARVADSGSTLPRDTVWYNGEQACNVSLSKDGSKRTLFLDFGGETGRSFVGAKYGTHERLLIADSTGSLVQSVGAPSGYSFDHSEWAGNKNLAVVTLTNVNGAHQKIALVDFSDSSVVELAEGDELWHPNLWVSESFSSTEDALLNLDSAGVYFVEGLSWYQEAVGFKMSLLWKFKDEVEILCVGSSRINDGVAVSKMQSGFALNMGHPGNDMNASLYIAENYGVNHLKKLKTIVVSLDVDLWHNTTEFSDRLFSGAPGFVYDRNHSFWKGEDMDRFAEIIESTVPFSIAIKNSADSLGWHVSESIEWGEPLVDLDSNWSSSQMEALDWNLNRLNVFVKEMGDKNINVVAVVFPQNPKYRSTGSWGRYGPKRTVAEKYLKAVSEIARENSNFILLDENKNGSHDYSDESALNSDHLSYLGAEKLTARLDSLLKTLK